MQICFVRSTKQAEYRTVQQWEILLLDCTPKSCSYQLQTVKRHTDKRSHTHHEKRRRSESVRVREKTRGSERDKKGGE